MNIIVDGKTIEAREGVTLLTALLENGIDVPNLCHLPELEPYGGCGLCLVEIEGMAKPARACAISPWEGMKVTSRSPRIDESRQMSLGMLLSDHRGDCRPPCHLACPAGQDCQAYIGLIADGFFDEAFQLVMEDNPLPASIGRVCPHPCEDACRRKLLEGPVSLMQLKRFVAEKAGGSFVPHMEAATGKRVAVVGAGPAGLTAAYFLARSGHAVDVFEMMPAPGGMLRYGIPSYRLPKKVLDAEVARIEKMGVAIHYNTRLGVDITIDGLKGDYDAVFVGIGAWESARIGCEGDSLTGVLGGIDFLADVAQGVPPDIGRRVAVVGGGNTAMDAVRTAVRLGADEVHLIYRRTRAEMPAEDLEIEEAEEEGVQFTFLSAPECVLEEDGRAVGLRLGRMRLGEPDASGRRRPEPTGETVDVQYDTIIAAIGQKVRSEGVEDLERTRWRTVVADPATFETNIPGVFAGGDAVNDGPGIAIAAIGHGKRAATSIDRYLKGQPLPVKAPFYVKQKDFVVDDIPDTPAVPRVRVKMESPATRTKHFREFVRTLSVKDAVQEAKRCLECGCCDLYDCRLLPLLQEYDAEAADVGGRMRRSSQDRSHPTIWRDENKCVLCGLCVRACDTLEGVCALGFDGRGFETSAQPAFDWPMAESDCISCGYCVQICPTGALQERRPFAKTPPLHANIETVTCEHCARGCRFTLEKQGKRVLRALPVDRQMSCSIGRYAPVILNAPSGSFTREQRQTLASVLVGDLRVFEGQMPESIGEIDIVSEA